MINQTENKKISKFLSFVLRHKPETIGLQLDENGWADTKELVEKMNDHGISVTADILDHIVATNSKQRFAFNETKTRIRASQGHSIDIDLNLKETKPPEYLYHGTGEKNVSPILKTGLEKGNRQHVHLSIDIKTAIDVGQRHGKPKVFIIASGQMSVEGFSFYLSDNAVWLIDNVPVKYLKLIEK